MNVLLSSAVWLSLLTVYCYCRIVPQRIRPEGSNNLNKQYRLVLENVQVLEPPTIDEDKLQFSDYPQSRASINNFLQNERMADQSYMQIPYEDFLLSSAAKAVDLENRPIQQRESLRSRDYLHKRSDSQYQLFLKSDFVLEPQVQESKTATAVRKEDSYWRDRRTAPRNHQELPLNISCDHPRGNWSICKINETEVYVHKETLQKSEITRDCNVKYSIGRVVHPQRLHLFVWDTTKMKQDCGCFEDEHVSLFVYCEKNIRTPEQAIQAPSGPTI